MGQQGPDGHWRGAEPHWGPGMLGHIPVARGEQEAARAPWTAFWRGRGEAGAGRAQRDWGGQQGISGQQLPRCPGQRPSLSFLVHDQETDKCPLDLPQSSVTPRHLALRKLPGARWRPRGRCPSPGLVPLWDACASCLPGGFSGSVPPGRSPPRRRLPSVTSAPVPTCRWHWAAVIMTTSESIPSSPFEQAEECCD